MGDGPPRSVLTRFGPLIVLLGLVTLVVVGVLLHGGVNASQVGRAYVLGLGAAVILAVLLEVGQMGPRRGADLRSTRTTNPQLPPELAQLQDSLRAGRVSGAHYEQAVVPLLREIASDRLLQLGISLDREPERAAVALGDRLSAALVGRAQGGAPDAARRTPSQRELASLLSALEAVDK